jgi:hypothetical protein
MTLAVEKAYEHIGESHICSDYLRDLIHEMGKRLDALWRYDQYIANAEEHAFVQEFWSTLKLLIASACSDGTVLTWKVE